MGRPISRECLVCGVVDILQPGEGEEIIGLGECDRQSCIDRKGDYSNHPQFLQVEEVDKTMSQERGEPVHTGSRRQPRRECR